MRLKLNLIQKQLTSPRESDIENRLIKASADGSSVTISVALSKSHSSLILLVSLCQSHCFSLTFDFPRPSSQPESVLSQFDLFERLKRAWNKWRGWRRFWPNSRRWASSSNNRQRIALSTLLLFFELSKLFSELSELFPELFSKLFIKLFSKLSSKLALIASYITRSRVVIQKTKTF